MLEIKKKEADFYIELLKKNLEAAQTILGHIINLSITDAVGLSKDCEVIEVSDQVEKNYEVLSIIVQYFEKHGFDF